jgi:hypothetical protein
MYLNRYILGIVMSVVVVHMNGELTMETKPSGYKSYGSLQHSWKTLTHDIQLYAKKRGKAGNENKYEFPPPVDAALYFGNCLLVNPSGDLTPEMWNEFYESIMQFEDIEETEEEEEEIIDGEYSHGYLKDGFVVSDNELEEEPYNLPTV